MADWLSSLRSAGARTPAKPVIRNNNNLSVCSRQLSLQDEPSATSTATKDDVTDSLDSRTASQTVLRGKPGELDSNGSRFPKTPRRKGPIPARQACSNVRSQHDQHMDSTSPLGSPRASSVKSTDDASIVTDDDLATDAEGDCVQVCVRVRPVNDNERRNSCHQYCIHVIGTRTMKLFMQKNRSEPHTFHYDNVFADESSQQEVFELTGYPVVENCLNGYNSTIFAYGQTGAGKTFTMLGHLSGLNGKHSELRGLAPRVFEYLFQRITASEDCTGRENITYSCRCSFLEIYNETITDLLNPSATNLQIREDIKKGCYVDGLSEESVVNVEEMLALMKRGADNRHVGETRMNRESSRSHSVFTLTLERCSRSSNGLTNIVFSRLNLIDLAGSERQKKSEVAGSHLKEACHINKSLTILGRVIHELVEAQRSGRKSHVPYRDSRLTFLLQDSLGGNAKTWIIANVSPSSCCSQETLSTLQFAQRAKRIRNRAVVNMDTRGDVVVLQKEIIRLNQEIHNLRGGVTDAYVMENAQLRTQLEEQDRLHQEVQLKYAAVQTEVHRYKRERDRAEGKMQQFTASQAQLLLALSRTESALKTCQAEDSVATEKEIDVFQQECTVMKEEKRMLMIQVAEMEDAGNNLRLQLFESGGREAQLLKLLHREKAGSEHLQGRLAMLQTDNAQLLTALQDEHAKVSSGQSLINAVGEDLAMLRTQYAAKEAELSALSEQVVNEQKAKDQLAAALQGLEAQLSAQSVELSAAFSSIKVLRLELERSGADVDAINAQLNSEKAASELLRSALDSVTSQLNISVADWSNTCRVLEAEQQDASIVRKELSTLQAHLSAAGVQAKLDAEAMHALQDKLSNVTNQMAGVELALAASQKELQEEQLHKVYLQDKLHAVNQQLLAECKANADREAAADTAWCAKVADLELDIQILQNQLEQQHQQHVSLQAQAQALSEDMKDQVSELTGRYTSTKAQLEVESQARKQSDVAFAQLAQELESTKQHFTTEQAHAHGIQEQLKGQASILSAQLIKAEAQLEAESCSKVQAQEYASKVLEELQCINQLLAQEQTVSHDAGVQLSNAQHRNGELEEEMRKLSQAGLKLRDQLKFLSDKCEEQHVLVEKLMQEHVCLVGYTTSLQQDLKIQQRTCKEAQQKISVLSEQLQMSEAKAISQVEEMQQILSSVKQEYEETVAKHAATIRSRMEDVRQAEEKHQEIYAELEKKLAAAEDHVAELSLEKGDLLATLDDKLESLTALKQGNTILKEQLETLQGSLVDEGTQLEDAREQISKLEAQLKETLDKLHDTTRERNTLHQELNTFHHTAEHTTAAATQTQLQQQKQIEALQKDLSEAGEQLARQEHKMKQQVHHMTFQLENSNNKAASLQNALVEEQQEIKQLKHSLAKAKASCAGAERHMATLGECVKELQQKNSDLTAETDTRIRRLSSEMHALQQQLAAANQRLEASYKANTCEAVKVARFAHAFQEMRRLIETAHVMDSVSPGHVLEVTPSSASIRAGSLHFGHHLPLSPSKRHSSLMVGDGKETELSGLRDQIRAPTTKIAQQLRASMDDIADILA